MLRYTPYFFLASAVVLSFVGLVFSHFDVPRVTKASTINQDIDYWKNIVSTKPTYRDGYLVLSQLERIKGNTAAAERYMSIANAISPEKRDTQVLGVSVIKEIEK